MTEKNRLLDGVLAGLPLQEYPFITPAQWEGNEGGRYETDGQATFDVVIFDKVQPQRFPAGNYLLLGALPPLDVLSAGEPVKNHPLIWWDETHPVLRYVALEYVYVGESRSIKAPPEAETLVEGPGGPVLVRYARDGRNCLICGFAVEQSTWWSKQSFPIFMYNAIRYLGGLGEDMDRAIVRPGDTLRVPAPAGADKLTLIRPDGEHVRLTPDATATAYYGGTDRCGVYRVEAGVAGRDQFAVNLQDRLESDIAPAETIRLGGSQDVAEIQAIRTATPEVWRWFVGAALALLLLEWWVYNRRVMI